MKNKEEIEKVWRERVARFESRGTMSAQEFCREEGFSREAVRYWQKKFGQGQGSGSSRVSRAKARRAFIPVSIDIAAGAPPRLVPELLLPNSVWLAKVLVEIVRATGDQS